MKKIYPIFLVLLFLFGSTSCNDDDFQLNAEKEFAQCDIENDFTEWSAFRNTQTGSNLFSSAFDHYNKHGELRGTLGFTRISLDLGLYNFVEPSRGNDTGYVFYSTFLGDGDVLGEPYGNRETDQPAWYEIEEYDPSLNFVKGTFEVMLYAGEEKELPNSPNSLYFSNGSFEIYLEM